MVTGGTGGIGTPLVEALLLCGANVIVIGRNEKKIVKKFSI
jgi:short-subunit dehydrogenase involved in D-alanine esterification of teichoic acids